MPCGAHPVPFGISPTRSGMPALWLAPCCQVFTDDVAGRIKTELAAKHSRTESERRVLTLSRAWEATQHLLQPAPDHIRLAMLRELQAASYPQKADVPPLMRATTPLEYHVVDLDHFLLSSILFYDFSAHYLEPKHASPFASSHGGSAVGRRKPAASAAGSLTEFPLAAAQLAVLRRSILLTAPPTEETPPKDDATNSVHQRAG